MRWSVVIGYVIARARRQCICKAMLMLNRYLAFYDKDDMTFMAPVVSHVVGAVDDKTKLDISKLARTYRGGTRYARMYRLGDLRPICYASGEMIEIHGTEYIEPPKVIHYPLSRKA